MRFLHCFDTAGIGALLSHELTKLGHNSMVVQWSQLDPFGFGAYYKNTVYYKTPDEVISNLNSLHADHIILHDYADKLSQIKHKNKSIIYHGSQLRHVYKDALDIEYNCKNTFITTQDLFEFRPGAKLLHRPVDRELFSPLWGLVDCPQRHLNICVGRNEELMKRVLPESCEVLVREKNITPYHDMPKFLSDYTKYYDMKFDYSHPPKPIPEQSITGLQCLSMGIPTETWRGLKTTFPEEHDSRHVVKEFLRHFEL